MSATIIPMDKQRAGRALVAAGHPREVGLRIAAALERVNLTQADLVRQLHLSSSQVSQWINGVHLPRLDHLYMALPYLEVPLQYILIGDEAGLDYVARQDLRDRIVRLRAEREARASEGARKPGRPRRATAA